MGSKMSSEVWTRLRPAAAALAAVALVPFFATGAADAGPSGTTLTLTSIELSTVRAINDLRVSHGLAALEISPALFGSARLHCRQMVEGGYFGHESAGGSGFAARMASFYPQGRYRYYSAGENLLWTREPMSSDAMIASWMRSPEHRANLLDPAWRQVAVAALIIPSAPGIYDDAPVTVVTADFGVRR